MYGILQFIWPAAVGLSPSHSETVFTHALTSLMQSASPGCPQSLFSWKAPTLPIRQCFLHQYWETGPVKLAADGMLGHWSSLLKICPSSIGAFSRDVAVGSCQPLPRLRQVAGTWVRVGRQSCVCSKESNLVLSAYLALPAEPVALPPVLHCFL